MRCALPDRILIIDDIDIFAAPEKFISHREAGNAGPFDEKQRHQASLPAFANGFSTGM
ncbi:hypothetical protein D3C87_2098570 [compost metagenome]